MSDLLFAARAPSNIALIKYMGKKVGQGNLPENGSISMTLDALCSVAEVSLSDDQGGRGLVSHRVKWVPERPRGFQGLPLEVPLLDDAGILKLIRHAERMILAADEVFPRYGIPVRRLSSLAGGGSLVFRTANTFPQASGIASSASSFAAITVATALACAQDRNSFERAWSSDRTFREDLAKISRQGSGSSCRSLGGPWVMWEEEQVSVLPAQMPKMAHFVLLVSDRQKSVSSSEAHLRVKSSPLWEKRPERVAVRLMELKGALAKGDLSTIAQIAWTEAWEMHSLFHTCAEPFTYWEPATLHLLRELGPFVFRSRPPIVTLDAGPNIHVIVEESQKAEWLDRLNQMTRGDISILMDQQGTGVSL